MWGLTFKAGTDDRRYSPALAVTRRLLAKGAVVRAYDPTVPPAPPEPGSDLDGLVLCGDPYEAARGTVAVVVLTEWDEFRWIDFAKLGGLMAASALVDARNLLDPAALRRVGFTYSGIGRP